MSNSYNYQPFYNENYDNRLIKINFNNFAYLTVALPFFGFIFCVCFSLIFNFENATSTHCGVFNFLPSISAAIGSFSPQKEVWQICIALHALPRFILALMYRKYHKEILFPWAHFLSSFAIFLNIVEAVCLIGLSFWTSSENYPVHKTCFVTFIITSELYMLLSCLLLKRCRRHPANFTEIQALNVKFRLVIMNIICIILASYFFMRHNSYCETGVYSLFALFEYVVVLSNMAFHFMAKWDFKDRDLVLNKNCSIDLPYR